MSLEKVRELFIKENLEDRIVEFNSSSATVELAAEQIGCSSSQIAKTMSFKSKDDYAILIVTKGSSKIDNRKFKDYFKMKAKMLKRDEVEEYVGYLPGGVCPFAVKENCKVYLDISLKEHEEVYPAAGSASSVVKLNLEELQKLSNYIEWIDVCI